MKKILLSLFILPLLALLAIACADTSYMDYIEGHHSDKGAYTWLVQIDKMPNHVDERFHTDEEPKWINGGAGGVLALTNFRSGHKIFSYREIVSGHHSVRVFTQHYQRTSRDNSSYEWKVEWDRSGNAGCNYFYTDTKPEWISGIGNGVLKMTNVKEEGKVYETYYLFTPNDNVSVERQ